MDMVLILMHVKMVKTFKMEFHHFSGFSGENHSFAINTILDNKVPNVNDDFSENPFLKIQTMEQ